MVGQTWSVRDDISNVAPQILSAKGLGPVLGRHLSIVLFGLATLGATFVRGQNAEPGPVAPRVLTNIVQIWEIPREERVQPHDLHTEFIIYYFDPEWSVAFGECKGVPAFLPITDCPEQLRGGDRVALDGIVVPARERLDWKRTKIRIMERGLVLQPERVRSLDTVTARERGHVIAIEGLVDHELSQGTNHTKIDLLVGGTTATVHLLNPVNR